MPTTLRNEVRRVLDELATLQQRGNGRMALELVEHVADVQPALDQVGQQRPGADRKRLPVRVDETVAEQPSGRLAEDLHRHAQAGRHVESLVDDLLGQADQFLSHERLLGRVPLPMESSLLCQQRVGAVG